MSFTEYRNKFFLFNILILSMMKYNKHLKLFLTLLIIWGAQNKLYGQIEKTNLTEKDSVYLITLNDGGEIIGKIISDDGREITIVNSKNEKTIIPKYVIKSKEMMTNKNNSSSGLVYPNPHPSRYVFSPSALPLKKGEGYINAFYFLIWQAQYGITENFSLGLTTSWFLVPTFLNAKYTIALSEDLNIAVGGQFGKLYMSDDNSVALGFGTITYGTPESNISLNAGYGSYANNGISILTLSGTQRIGKSASILGEVWYCQPNSADPFMMGGPAFRFYGGRKATFDIAITAIGFKKRNIDYDPWSNTFTESYEWKTYYPIPILSISYKI